MTTLREQVEEVLATHEAGEAVTSGGGLTEGSVGCECGWDVDVWKVAGDCSCYDDVDVVEDLDQVDDNASCAHDEEVDRTSNAHSKQSKELVNTHLATELANALNGDRHALAENLMVHEPLAQVTQTPTGVVLLATCSCGFSDQVWSLDGACECSAASTETCEFHKNLWAKVSANNGWVTAFDHLIDQLVNTLSK